MTSRLAYTPDRDADAAALEPDVVICDSHHHLWPASGMIPYPVEALARDTRAGHRVLASVFVECHHGYRTGGPEALRSVGETELAVRLAAESRRLGGAEIRGIVASTDLRLGHDIDHAIDAHLEAGGGLLRGFRARAARDPAGQHVTALQQVHGLMSDPAFRAGAVRIGRRGLVLELIFYHPQLQEAIDLVSALPDIPVVVDHLAMPLLVGDYGRHRAEVMSDWRRGIARLAARPQVTMKVGGFGMSSFGHGWQARGRPASSDEIVAQFGEFVSHAIDAFGPVRCMFESNFPVDGLSFGYVTAWNAFKKLSSGYSPAERQALFYGTAVRTFGLNRAPR